MILSSTSDEKTQQKAIEQIEKLVGWALPTLH